MSHHPVPVCLCPAFDPTEFDGTADHAAACAICPVHGTGVEVVLAPVDVDLDTSAVKAAVHAGNCLCEHARHDLGQPHVYGAPAELTHWCVPITGPVCQQCATECLADWSAAYPGDVVALQ